MFMCVYVCVCVCVCEWLLNVGAEAENLLVAYLVTFEVDVCDTHALVSRYKVGETRKKADSERCHDTHTHIYTYTHTRAHTHTFSLCVLYTHDEY